MSNGVDYEYDFFISYPVRSSAGIWVRNHFLPLFHEELDNAYADGKVFCWLEEEVGVIWPAMLKQAHARSRLLVAILTPPYFYRSAWCPIEWFTMVKRQTLAKLDTNSLICPILYSDGSTLPVDARQITAKDFRRWAFPELQFKDSQAYLDFRLAVRELVDELVSKRLPLVPHWSGEWPEIDLPPLPMPRAELPRL